MGQTARLWPLWTQNVKNMIESGCIVRASCRKCGALFVVDLDAIRAVKGGFYSLIDRKAPCKLVKCDGACIFLYSPHKGTPFRPLLN